MELLVASLIGLGVGIVACGIAAALADDGEDDEDDEEDMVSWAIRYLERMNGPR